MGYWGEGIPLAAPPLWIPAFAGMTHGGCGNAERGRRPCASPLPWVPAFAGTTVWLVGSGERRRRPRAPPLP